MGRWLLLLAALPLCSFSESAMDDPDLQNAVCANGSFLAENAFSSRRSFANPSTTNCLSGDET